MLTPPLKAGDQYLCLRIGSTSNLTWVKVNVDSRTDGAGSPHTAVVDSENWKLEVNRKPIGLRKMGGWMDGWMGGSMQYLKRN